MAHRLPDDLVLDLGVTDAILNFIAWGLPPGGFTTSLLLRDKKWAYARAHPNLKPINGHSEDIVANLFLFVETLIPEFMFDSEEKMFAWMDHEGLDGASDSDSMALYMHTTFWHTSKKAREKLLAERDARINSTGS